MHSHWLIGLHTLISLVATFLLGVLLALDGEGAGARQQLVGQHAHAPPVNRLEEIKL